MGSEHQRRMLHEVMMCPHCGERHRFSVIVQMRAAGETAMPLFGGGPGPAKVAFTCPVTHKIINETVPDPPDGHVIGPDDSAPPNPESVATTVAPSASLGDLEYADWIKASRTTAVEFCKTMLATATGAVPVYFAVLKYLGSESSNGSWFSRIAALPPLLFLSAAIICALALRPRLAVLTPSDFATFRGARLRQLNRDLVTGLSLFATGVLIAIALGVAALGHWPAAMWTVKP